MIAQKLEEQLIQGESFSTALEKMKLFRQEFIWLVLEGEKTRQLDVQLQVYPDQMLDKFTQRYRKENQVDSTVTTYRVGFLIVSMYLIYYYRH